MKDKGWWLVFWTGYRGKVFIRRTFEKGPKWSRGDQAIRLAFPNETRSSSKGLKQPSALESLQTMQDPRVGESHEARKSVGQNEVRVTTKDLLM